MKHPLIDAVEKKYRRENELDFGIGETVRVTIKIVEGNKERLQDFEGVVIARRGSGLDEMFTVRRLVGNEGVERTFPLHSPKVVRIKTVRRGKIRRCKLYYLRERVGRARKLRERRISAEARKAALEAQLAKARALREADEVAKAAREREAAAKAGSPEMATSEA
ncbi:MAG: 50S ribosomal protein L19 [Phycisphaerae bacterium]|jgi:large subunit ribosomal protein L19|nr:50S ribosomal protein L19 [Phycisphaerae bacterium]NLG42493.1 50S ribosomal protein L19 [Phycisphaerae bacterium]